MAILLPVIINASAGLGYCGEFSQQLLAKFAAHGYMADITLAQSGEEMIAAARAAVEAGARMVVAGGGDGTINAVASVLAGTDVAYGVLPLGTLNHFAKDLKIPLELDAAIAAIATGGHVRVDVGEVNGRIFLNNSSLGLYPDIVRDREKQQSRLGRGKWLAFTWAALAALRRYPFLNVRLSVNGEEHARRTPFVFIGNNEYLMQGLNIGARERINGGKLSLYVAQRPSRLGLVRLAWHALLGTLARQRDFDVLLATEMEIDTRNVRDTRIRVATDGEVTVMHTPLSYRMRAGALIVVTPKNS
ncbi:diacylglycerol/lipid kinase family protein [Pseudoduganella aquatica]|uniref:Sphingosine kinase n=1 Tax=Pseudoduganella aquatica TaxID=2660641 RepID=A0A7X4HGT7_9BURK|nr:diacylglycerol kinase family protein [Pseudoduganella aquatica]MYN10934.1 sphingosine kinase [Pseudoduganella aquatica]